MTTEAKNSSYIDSEGALNPEQQRELETLQENSAQNCINFLEVRTDKDLFPLVAMATGIGKGKVIHKVIEKTIRKKPDAKILVIAGTKLVLVDQTQEALAGYLQSPDYEYIESEDSELTTPETEEVNLDDYSEDSFLYSVADYKRKNKSTANVHVATVQTMQRESTKDEFDPDYYDLVIVDEAHNVGTEKRQKLIKNYKNVVGFTASPHRHNGVLKNPEEYGFTVIDSLTLPEAQERDLLPPLIEVAINTTSLIDEIPTTLNGHINFKKLEKLLKNSPELLPFIAGQLYEKIVDGNNKLKTVVAVNFVWEAQELAKLLHDRGVSVGVAVNEKAAKLIDSEEIPALDAIKRYKLSKDDPDNLQVLISPYVAAEGFDAPVTEAVAWASATDSSVRYTQFTGRGARRFPGKSYGLVIDFLYQTAQYGWSYNFGQWMKDTAVELPNGMLFQGSRAQMERVIASTGFRNIQLKQPRDTITLESLQHSIDNEPILYIQPEDFPLGVAHLHNFFVGDQKKLQAGADLAVEEISKEHPELFIKRRNGSHIVLITTDRDLFTKTMLEIGISLQEKALPPQPGDILINQVSLEATFTGNAKYTRPVAEIVLAEIQKERPDLIVRRSNRGHILNAIIDGDYFKAKMLEKGVEPTKTLDAPQRGEFIINPVNIAAEFIGSRNRIQPLVNLVLDEMRSENPDLVVNRRSHNAISTAVTNKQLFIQKMLEKGAILQQNDVLPPQENDFLFNNAFITNTFIGRAQEVRQLAQEVIEEIRREKPDLIVQRKNINTILTAITDSNLFIRKMVERGAILQTTLPVQPEDSLVADRHLRERFIGDNKKLSTAAEAVIEEMKRETPELVKQRRNGMHIVDVVSDFDVFKRKMEERGIRSRE